MNLLKTIQATARDTLIIVGLALLGAAVVVPLVDGSTAHPMRARIALVAWVLPFVIAGFSMSGYRTPRRRWIHLLRVTSCVLILSLAIEVLDGASIGTGFLTGVILLTAMGIGGAISFALRKDPGDAPTRPGSVEPSTRTTRARTLAGERISWLQVVGTVLSSNLFLVASCFGIMGASIQAMKHSGGQYTARGEAPDSNMIVIASIPDPAVPGQRKLEAVTLRGLSEFQSAHPDLTFLIPAGSGRIDCNSYRATALGAGEVRVETAAHCDDLFGLEVVGSYEAAEREVRPIHTNRTFMVEALFVGLAGACMLRMIGSILQWVQRRRRQRYERTK